MLTSWISDIGGMSSPDLWPPLFHPPGTATTGSRPTLLTPTHTPCSSGTSWLPGLPSSLFLRSVFSPQLHVRSLLSGHAASCQCNTWRGLCWLRLPSSLKTLTTTVRWHGYTPVLTSNRIRFRQIRLVPSDEGSGSLLFMYAPPVFIGIRIHPNLILNR